MRRAPWRAGAALSLALVLVLVLSAAACGGSRSGASRDGGGHVTVLAAASLTEVFGDLAAALRRGDRPVTAALSFAGSQQLVAQVDAGAPADVVAMADEASMQQLVDRSEVDRPVVFARNRLTIAVAPGNPKHVTGLADLARSDLSVVLADPAVPVGKYAAEALRRAGATVRPRSLELDVKAALRKVASGDADAAIVYETDVRAAGATVAGVAIRADLSPTAAYPIAVVRSTRHRAAATAFVAALTGPQGRRFLTDRGFEVP